MSKTRLPLPPVQEVICQKDAAASLGVSPNTIKAMVQRGEIPAPFRLGRRKCWSRSHWRAFLEEKAGAAVRVANRDPLLSRIRGEG
jgi:excisionase family DNA binding protein